FALSASHRASSACACRFPEPSFALWSVPTLSVLRPFDELLAHQGRRDRGCTLPPRAPAKSASRQYSSLPLGAAPSSAQARTVALFALFVAQVSASAHCAHAARAATASLHPPVWLVRRSSLCNAHAGLPKKAVLRSARSSV